MAYKIEKISTENFGVIPYISLDSLTRINLLIGENGTGKTFLLKALYTTLHSAEEYKRGDDIRPFPDVLAEKLRWTFQVDELGDLVKRGVQDTLRFSMTSGEDLIEYQFSQSARSKIVNVTSPKKRRDTNSIFLPAKEVLSLFPVIMKSREIDRSFGFDDTYYD